ncbi:hypothetical protein KUCAC02_017686, partial [Chaenocephalus aceratus]
GSNQELAADKRPFTQVRSREMGATSGDAKPSPEGPTQSSPIRETPQRKVGWFLGVAPLCSGHSCARLSRGSDVMYNGSPEGCWDGGKSEEPKPDPCGAPGFTLLLRLRAKTEQSSKQSRDGVRPRTHHSRLTELQGPYRALALTLGSITVLLMDVSVWQVLISLAPTVAHSDEADRKADQGLPSSRKGGE